MADTAYQIQYRQEIIFGFEQNQSLLRDSVTNEAVIKGNQARFIVVDSNGASTTTRGMNGKIPGRLNNKEVPTATLTEEHDKCIETGFNIFASQGDQKIAMQKTSMGVINRRIDEQILDQLATGTVNTGAAVTASMNLIVKAKAILGNSKVPFDGAITAVITPAFEGYLAQVKEFASADYVNGKPLPDGVMTWKDMPMMYRWLGINFIVSNQLPGLATNAEKCYMYHRSAIGHAIDIKGIQTYLGYDEEDDYSFCRSSFYAGAKLLQNSGVVVMNHDGSAFAAS